MRRVIALIVAVGALVLAGSFAHADLTSVGCNGSTGVDVSCDAGSVTVSDPIDLSVTPVGTLGSISTVTVSLKSTSGEATRTCSLLGPEGPGLGSCGDTKITGEFTTDPAAECTATAAGLGIGEWSASCTVGLAG